MKRAVPIVAGVGLAVLVTWLSVARASMPVRTPDWTDPTAGVAGTRDRPSAGVPSARQTDATSETGGGGIPLTRVEAPASADHRVRLIRILEQGEDDQRFDALGPLGVEILDRRERDEELLQVMLRVARSDPSGRCRWRAHQYLWMLPYEDAFEAALTALAGSATDDLKLTLLKWGGELTTDRYAENLKMSSAGEALDARVLESLVARRREQLMRILPNVAGRAPSVSKQAGDLLQRLQHAPR